MTKIILPCPFCGCSHDAKDPDVVHPNGIGWLDHEEGFRHYLSARGLLQANWCYVVNCPEIYGGCGAQMSGDSKEEVIAKWNTRFGLG